jgi:hypothetical protein
MVLLWIILPILPVLTIAGMVMLVDFLFLNATLTTRLLQYLVMGY